MRRLTYTLLVGLFWAGSILASFVAWGEISHVSVNQQQFVLGAYPKLKLNIVAQEIHPDKMQFILSQRSGSERLMVRPLNSYLLELTGIEDVNDPDAQLIVKEYRVNRWVDVKRIALFAGQSADLSQVSATQERALKPRSAQAVPASLADPQCQLDYHAGQTLWRLASQYSEQWQLTTYGAMLAIFDANPKAFNRGNIHGLMAHASLVCPSAEIKQRYQDPKLAKQTFEAM